MSRPIYGIWKQKEKWQNHPWHLPKWLYGQQKNLCQHTQVDFRPNVLPIDQVLADAGYDSEFNHEFCRDKLNIRSTIIAYNPRRTSKLPTAKYRRQMATKFDTKTYGRRWQVESVFSGHKRLSGSALRNRNAESRKRECLLKVLTHNLMIIRRAA